MADLIKKIKIKKQDGTFTDYIPIGADARNITFSNNYTLENIVGLINPEQKGSVADQLNKVIRYYDCVADMKADLTLTSTSVVRTLGYYEPNDNGGALYEIIDEYDDRYDSAINNNGKVHSLQNGNKALMIIENNSVNIEQFGIRGTDNDSAAKLRSAFKQLKTDNVIINFNANEYTINNTTVWTLYSGETDGLGLYLRGNKTRSKITIKLSNRPTGYIIFDIRNSINKQKLIFENIDIYFEFQEDIEYDSAFRPKLIYGSNFDLTIKNCHFETSLGPYTADLVYLFNPGNVEIRDSQIIKRAYTDSERLDGGTIFLNLGTSNNNETCIIENSWIYDNGHDEVIALWDNLENAGSYSVYINNSTIEKDLTYHNTSGMLFSNFHKSSTNKCNYYIDNSFLYTHSDANEEHRSGTSFNLSSYGGEANFFINNCLIKRSGLLSTSSVCNGGANHVNMPTDSYINKQDWFKKCKINIQNSVIDASNSRLSGDYNVNVEVNNSILLLKRLMSWNGSTLLNFTSTIKISNSDLSLLDNGILFTSNYKEPQTLIIHDSNFNNYTPTYTQGNTYGTPVVMSGDGIISLYNNTVDYQKITDTYELVPYNPS